MLGNKISYKCFSTGLSQLKLSSMKNVLKILALPRIADSDSITSLLSSSVVCGLSSTPASKTVARPSAPKEQRLDPH